MSLQRSARLMGLLLWGSGCQRALPDDLSSCSPVAPGTTSAVSFDLDVRPILARTCLNCHAENGSAPFVLERFEQVAALAPLLRQVLETHAMPPWGLNPCCNQYREDRSLSAEARETLLKWLDEGAPRGAVSSARDAPKMPEPFQADLRLMMPEPFVPQRSFNNAELRCFLIDWPIAHRAYVTGLRVVPGDQRIVHHALVHTIPQERARALRERDYEDGRPGWDCYGRGVSASETTGLGGWAPGYAGTRYPAGMGIEVAPEQQLLLVIHYDLSNAEAAQDQTSIELQLESEVSKVARSLGLAHPLWLLGDGLKIEPGEQKSYHVRLDPSVLLIDAPYEVWGASLHMHERGAGGRIAAARRDGSFDCILDIPNFAFEWQGEHLLQTPVRMESGDALVVECRFDNRWGEETLRWGTDQEMCTGFVLVSEL